MPGKGVRLHFKQWEIHSCLEVRGKDRSYTKVSRKEGATFRRQGGRVPGSSAGRWGAGQSRPTVHQAAREGQERGIRRRRLLGTWSPFPVSHGRCSEGQHTPPSPGPRWVEGCESQARGGDGSGAVKVGVRPGLGGPCQGSGPTSLVTSASGLIRGSVLGPPPLFQSCRPACASALLIPRTLCTPGTDVEHPFVDQTAWQLRGQNSGSLAVWAWLNSALCAWRRLCS